MNDERYKESYSHHVCGIFAQREAAEAAADELARQGLARGRLQLLDAASLASATSPQAAQHSDQFLTRVLVDGAVGAAVGTGLGALAEVALVAANVSLFIASPLLAPLAMLGWGASLGALVGSVAGFESPKVAVPPGGGLADLIRDAINSGQVALVVQTHSEAETQLVTEAIRVQVGEIQAPLLV